MEGVLRNRWFILIQVIIISGQVLIISLGGKAFAVQSRPALPVGSERVAWSSRSPDGDDDSFGPG